MDGIDTGLNFNFTYAPGVSLEQMTGFEMAGQFWSQYLADNVSINIFVEMTEYLPENVVGGALPGIEENVRYETFRKKLKKDITSDVDTLINRNQQDENEKFTAYFSSQFDELAEGYQVDSNEYMKITRANAKALGIINPHDSKLDGYVLMSDLSNLSNNKDNYKSNDIQWHYGYNNNNISTNKLDFLSVAIHEIGHTLGFISGLDQANWLAGKRYINEDNEDDYYSDLIGNLNNATPVDMLRFSKASYEMSGDDENWIDMSIGNNPYLSFTGSGGKPVAYFATGENTDLGGDGNQASHWKKQENTIGIMDPLLGAGQRRQITNLDKQLFDAIGWDIQKGGADLETIHTEARTNLAEKIIVTAEKAGIDIDDDDLEDWVEGEFDDDELDDVREVAEVLTPDYLDLDGNNYDDRGEQLQEMIVNSGEVYEWGWKGYWWGWKGYWWGWKGYWQSADDFSQDGFWQNMSWQNLDVSGATHSSNKSSSVTESSEIDLVATPDNITPGTRVRTNNLANYRQNRDLFVNKDNDRVFSQLKEENTDNYDFSDRDKQIKRKQYLQNPLSDILTDKQDKRKQSQSYLLSDSLISKPLVAGLNEHDSLVMRI